MATKRFLYRAMLVTAVLTVGLAAHSTGAQDSDSAELLFEEAIHKEVADGDLEGAIELYKQVLDRFPDNRAVAAKALFQMAQSYEKLGDPFAQEVYERVLRDYADQQAQAAEARMRLAVLTEPASIAEPTEMVVRRVWSGQITSENWLGGVSPEGRYLSYRASTASGGGLAIHDLETGENRSLANEDSWSGGNVHSHRLSPNGQQVAYVWHNRDSFNDVRIVGVDGSEPRVLYRNAEASRRVTAITGTEHIVNRAVRAWSPDGQYVLVLFRREDRTNQIGLVSVADGSVRVLKTLDGVGPMGVSFSPDGRYIAYDSAGEHTRNRDIFLLATDGSIETPLIEHAANDQYPVWAPDGKRILFVSDRTGSLGAWLIQVADGKPQGSPELVKPDIGPIVRPLGFTRNGSFYYGLSTRLKDVYTATLDPATGLLSSPQKISQPFVGSNSQPDWSPDGQYLAYFVTEGPEPLRTSVMIRSVETGEVRELPKQIGYIQYYRGLRWSPDGRSLLVKGSHGGWWGLYQLDAETGAVTPIVQTTGSGGSRPEYSPDGRAIFYWRGAGTAANDDRGATRIVVRDIESGEERDLLHAVPPLRISHTMVVSPDGQRLAFFMEDRDTQSMALKVMPAAGGEPRELLRVHRPEDFGDLLNYSVLAWTNDGRELIFGKRTAASGTAVELWRISAEGGEPQSLGFAMIQLSHLRFHPDGRRITFDAREPPSDNPGQVWVMENFLPELSSAN